MKKFLWIIGVLFLVQFVVADDFFDSIRINLNTISSTGTDQDIVISPNGTGEIDADTSKVVNVTDPTAAQDAATKNYSDTTFLPFTGGTLTGSLVYQDGSEGTVGHVLTATDVNGTLALQAAAAAGADTDLSNLTSPTAINQSLIPDTDDAYNIGSSTDKFADVFSNEADLGTSTGSLFNTSWGTEIPGVVLDGTTTDALNAGAVGMVLKSHAGQSEMIFLTADQAGANASSRINIYTGYNTGTSNTGSIDLFTGSATGSSGNSGGFNFVTGDSTNGSSGNIKFETGTAGTTRGSIQLLDGSEGTTGECIISTDASGNVSFGPCGSGVGSVSFPDFEANDISNAATYDDAAATPVDLTGGTPNVTVTSETTNELSGTASYLFTKDAADRQGEGWTFLSGTIDRAESVGGQTQLVEFNYETSVNYVSGDVAVWVYKVGSNVLIQCQTNQVIDDSFTNNLPKADDVGRYQCSFALGSSDTGYRVGLHVATTNSSSYTIVTDRIRIGPDTTLNAPIRTQLIDDGPITIGAVTTAPTKGTTTVDKVLWARDGQFLIAYYEFDQTAVGSVGSGDYLVSLPAGLSMDTSIVTLNTVAGSIETQTTNIGQFTGNSGGSFDHNNGHAVPYSATQFRIVGRLGGGTAPWGSSGGGFNNTTVSIGGWIKVPIEGWGSGEILSATAADHETTTVYAAGNGGTAITANVTNIDFTETEDRKGVWSGTVFTAPTDGNYIIQGAVVANANNNGSIYAWVDGVQNIALGFMKNSSAATINGQLRLVAGEELTFRSDTAITLNNSTLVHVLSIQKQPKFHTFGVTGPYLETGTTGISSLTCPIANTAGAWSVKSTTMCDSWITSITDITTGTLDLIIPSGIFNETPACFCTAESASNGIQCAISSNTPVTSTLVRVEVYISAGTLFDEDVNVTCVAP